MGLLRRFLRRDRADTDHAREFQSYVEIEIDENIARGFSSDEARRAAHLKFGNAVRLREEVYTMGIDGLIQDIRYAARQWRHAPGFATVAVLTLALGVGANTAIFSVMNAVMLRLLPVHDAGRLVFLSTTSSIQAQSGDGDTSLTEHIFEQLREQRRVFTDLVAFAPLGINKVAVRYGTDSEEAQVDLVSGDFFSGLGVPPALGRTFTRAEEAEHAAVAVLNYAYWTRRMGRDPSVVGRPLNIKGVPFTIVGVAARDFAGVEYEKTSDIWIPLQTRPDLQPWGSSPRSGVTLYGTTPRWWCLKIIGRLGRDVTDEQALAAAGPVFERAALEGITKQYPKEQIPHLYFTPVRGVDGMRDDYGRPLAALMVMVAVVLVIACLNLAMLLIARNAGRRREFSLRLALGAGRLRLFRQLLTESLLLVSAGGLLGWFFAQWATGALAAWAALDLSFAPDRTVLLFTVTLSLLVGLAFGLAPLRAVVRLPIGGTLRASATTAREEPRGVRTRQVVLAVQIALCLVLLIGAGLLLATLRSLQTVDLGMRASGLLVFGVSPQNLQSDAEGVQFYQALLNRLEAIPGVESATIMRHRIGSGWSANSSLLVDGVDPRGDGQAHVRLNAVGPDFFHVLGASIVLGRDFAAADSATGSRVAVVNQTFARRYLANRNPVGHQAAIGGAPPSTIVGVVENMKYTGARELEMPMAWLPYTQVSGLSTMHVELRSTAEAEQLVPTVRRALREIAPDLALLQPMTQAEQFERSYSDSRLAARLALFFGLLAALLVATGLYGTLSYTVSRRTAEVGVRMALGARRSQVVWMVLRGSLITCLAGALLGVPLALGATSFLHSMLFGVKPGDPRIAAGALAGLFAIALLASWIPARRAASVDPMAALRHE